MKYNYKLIECSEENPNGIDITNDTKNDKKMNEQIVADLKENGDIVLKFVDSKKDEYENRKRYFISDNKDFLKKRTYNKKN